MKETLHSKPEDTGGTTVRTDEIVEDQRVIENDTNILFLSNQVGLGN